jgi:hypothetical protein
MIPHSWQITTQFFNYDNPVLLRGFQESSNRKPDQIDDLEKESLPEGKFLYCLTCQQKITNEKYKIQMRGKGEHTLFNPQGMLFHIGCFQEAQGCGVTGTPSAEFSWFPGYHWQIAYCSNCHGHLGWLFTQSSQAYFFGLILTRLKGD